MEKGNIGKANWEACETCKRESGLYTCNKEAQRFFYNDGRRGLPREARNKDIWCSDYIGERLSGYVGDVHWEGCNSCENDILDYGCNVKEVIMLTINHGHFFCDEFEDKCRKREGGKWVT